MIDFLSSYWTFGGALAAFLGFGVFLATPWGSPLLALLTRTATGRAILAIGGAVIAGLFALARARKIGREDERARAREATEKVRKTTEDIAREVGGMSDDDVRKELGKWARR
jgi:hypothetical protein